MDCVPLPYHVEDAIDGLDVRQEGITQTRT
jgi:hypothetical protein